ncbi:MAG TPA: hypothetical protein VGC71_12635 [Gaiellales bacterium]|jgi:hypothetical protein
MRARIGLVTVAVMLAPLIALGGARRHAPAFAEVATPAPLPAQVSVARERPRLCTPYAGCDTVALSAAGGRPPSP